MTKLYIQGVVFVVHHYNVSPELGPDSSFDLCHSIDNQYNISTYLQYFLHQQLTLTTAFQKDPHFLLAAATILRM